MGGRLVQPGGSPCTAQEVLTTAPGKLCKSISSALTSPPDSQRAEQIPVSTNTLTFIGLLDL